MDYDAFLEGYLPEASCGDEELAAALRHSLLGGGKKLRPRLMKLCFEAFDGKDDSCVPFMAAIEMIHCYSLVHDDLPAMDNDRMRHGKPSTWDQFGEDIGILAGDALLTLAFEISAQAAAHSDDPARAAGAISILAEKAGFSGMCSGQAADCRRTWEESSTPDALLTIYERKTSALLEAAAMIGALLAGANAASLQEAEAFARALGLAFQIQDDVLDVTAASEVMGKPAGSDERNHTVTYVSLLGLDAAREAVLHYTAEALQHLEAFPGDTEPLRRFTEMLSERDR